MADATPVMPPSRALVVNVLLSVLVSCSVFVIVAWLVLVPQMARQEAEIRELRANVVGLQNELDAATAEPAIAPVPVPAPAATPTTPPAPAATK